MNKTIKCQSCNRKFATKAALAEHVSAKHPGGARKKAPRVRPPAPGLVIQTPSTIRPKATDGATLMGTDLIANISDISAYTSQTLVLDQLIVPGLFKRLKAVASAFQRIKWNKLKFHVEPQMTSATSGGYIAAFVADPADVVNRVDPLPQLMAQKTSVATKWWQSSTLDVTLPNTLLYTSEGVEVRDYSPGSLVIASTAKASQKGALLVYAEWSVSLSKAGLESKDALQEEPKALFPLWLRKGYQGIYGRNGVDQWVQKPDLLVSGFEVGDFYQLPYPLAVQDGTSDSSFTIKLAHYLVGKSDELRLAMDKTDSGMSNNALDDVFLIPAGTPFVRFNAPKVAENPQDLSLTGPQLQESSTQGPQPSSQLVLTQLSELMTAFIKTLNDSLTFSTRTRLPEEMELSPLRASHRSMVSLQSWEECLNTQLEPTGSEDHLSQNQEKQG